MKAIVKRYLSVCKKSVLFFMFCMRMLMRRELRNPFKQRYTGRVAVLANGPSLKEVLPELNSEKFSDTDFIVMNFFGMEEAFTHIKPKHYCLADPMFFAPSHKEEAVKNLFSILNKKVDWEMNIYLPKVRVKDFVAFASLTNSHIHVIPLNVLPYRGFECWRYFFYKHGLSMPIAQTVANMAIFVGINSCYHQINLYGVDHTFFDGICVDRNNRLCNRETHFYDNDKVALKPILRTDNSQIWKIGEYVTAIGKMFLSHDLLASYARYMNVQIINCTKCSLIDSYDREK